MSFGRYLQISSTLLILTGFYAILSTGSYVVSVAIGMAVTITHGFAGERLTKIFAIPRWAWNTLAILIFSYLFYDTFFGELDLVGNGIKFVVYLQIVKLLSPKTNRDWIQIYLLSFLHILASTVISSDVTFALPFLIYIVLATWTLTLFNIKLQQTEAQEDARRENALRSLLRSKDIITSRFLTVTSILSLSIIAVTMLIFFSFPRLSMGNFLKRVTKHQRISGFSEEVELGTIGTIKTNDNIALRVEIPKQAVRKMNTERLYWRGTATDFFDGKKWSQSMPEQRRVRVDTKEGTLEADPIRFPGGEFFEYTVFLEALSTPIIIGADRLHRITWDKPFAERFFRGSIALHRNDEYRSFHFISSRGFLSDLSYKGESITGSPNLQLLRKASSKYPFHIRSYYLQLPKLNPKVLKLIENIEVPEASTYDRAIAIQQFLEKEYKYTLNVQDIGTDDPLRFFFLERKMGHCEYFSTALVTALRVHGIPARQVVGFRGGEWNPYGNYLAIRQSDAHTWVEVYFPRYGWIRFDPSPLDSEYRLSKRRLQAFFQFFDYLRLRWNKYIIEYDLRSQAAIIERIGRHITQIIKKSQKPKPKEALQKTQKTGKSLEKINPKTILLGSILLLFLGVVLFKIRGKRIRFKNGQHQNYANVLKILTRYGYQKLTYQTAEEFLETVEKDGELSSLQRITFMYNEERFGNFLYSNKEWEKEIFKLKQALLSQKQAARKRAHPKASNQAA